MACSTDIHCVLVVQTPPSSIVTVPTPPFFMGTGTPSRQPAVVHRVTSPPHLLSQPPHSGMNTCCVMGSRTRGAYAPKLLCRRSVPPQNLKTPVG